MHIRDLQAGPQRCFSAALLGGALALFAAGAGADQAADVDSKQRAAIAAPSAADFGHRYLIQYEPRAQRRLQRAMATTAAATEPGRATRWLKMHPLLSAVLNPDEAARLAQDPDVVMIEPDWPVYKAMQKTTWGVSQIQATELPTTGAPIKVCIVDSGYELSHPDLPQLDRVTGWVYEGPAGDYGLWDEPGDPHGTHVAGTIAALDNNIGVLGTHPGAGLSLHIAKVFNDDGDGTPTSVVLAGVESCIANGANVINLSLGGGNPSNAARGVYESADAAGILVFAASGNAGNNACSYPACYPTVISVGATEESMVHADFSQFTDAVDLAGPGASVRSTVLNGKYARFSGTSMATPHVAGGAALLWSLHPQCSHTQIADALRKSALDLGAPMRDEAFGHGLIQLAAADELLGNGCDVGEIPAPRVVTLFEGSFNVAAEEEFRVPFTVPDGAFNVRVKMLGNNDADLYLRAGKPPTTNKWDCRPYAEGSAEYCQVPPPAAAGEYHAMVRGFAGSSTIDLVIAHNLPPEGDDDDGGDDDEPGLMTLEELADLSRGSGKKYRSRVVAPANATKLVFNLEDGTGDADLYVREGSKPTLKRYDCVSMNAGNAERCEIDTPTPGATYHYLLNANTAFSGVTARVGYTMDNSGEPPPSSITIDLEWASSTRFFINWTGANGSKADIIRNGERVKRTANDGRLRDRDVTPGDLYQVCEKDSEVCSPVAVAPNPP
ncbi:MAG: S8 family serine peptidase [Pseudomonadota bacterium]